LLIQLRVEGALLRFRRYFLWEYRPTSCFGNEQASKQLRQLYSGYQLHIKRTRRPATRPTGDIFYGLWGNCRYHYDSTTFHKISRIFHTVIIIGRILVYTLFTGIGHQRQQTPGIGIDLLWYCRPPIGLLRRLLRPGYRIVLGHSIRFMYRRKFKTCNSPYESNEFYEQYRCSGDIHVGDNVLFSIGIIMGFGQIIGALIGSNLVVIKDVKFVRICFLSIVALTIMKLIYSTYIMS